jgi:Zn-dependent protease with chaperone function
LLEGSDVRSDRPDGRILVRLATLLGACGVVAAASALGAAIGSVHHISMAVRHLDVFGVRFSYPASNGAEWLLLGLAGLSAAAVTLAMRAFWRQRAAYRDFLDQLEIVGALEGHPTVKVIADPRPQAFCAGYLQPTVYVSQRALDLLSEPELRAVLAHEHHHRRVRDPLRLAYGRIAARALFFVPVLKSLWERYADLAELNADRAAVRASAGREAALASALLLFDASAPPGVSGISPERVDSLLGLPIRWRPRWWLTAASVGSLSSLGLLIWRTSQVASVHATFNPPFLSSTPCVVMSLLLALLGCAAVIRRLAASRRPARKPYASPRSAME